MTVIVGEGGSGGALAIGIANRVIILENAIYSVISPESCAAILWRDASEAPKAAESLRLTARDLIELEVVDRIVEEPVGGAHKDPEEAMRRVREALTEEIDSLTYLTPSKLLEQRRDRFRKLGQVRSI